MTYPSENRPVPDATTPPLAPEPPRTGSGLEPAGDSTGPERRDAPRVTHTRTSAAWVGIWAGVVALILLIIFIAQNTTSVEIAFFALEGRIPIALALLIAGVAGAIVAMAVAAARIVQLRRMMHRGH